MWVLAWVARVGLAAVFVVAGIGKLADRAGTRRAVVAFGVPPRLRRLVSIALPVAELATAALLLIPATAWWGALAALVLLALFSVAIAVNLGRGNMPDCHCFGQLHARPISRRMLWRNLAFGVVAFALVVLG